MQYTQILHKIQDILLEKETFANRTYSVNLITIYELPPAHLWHCSVVLESSLKLHVRGALVSPCLLFISVKGAFDPRGQLESGQYVPGAAVAP